MDGNIERHESLIVEAIARAATGDGAPYGYDIGRLLHLARIIYEKRA